MTKDNHPFKAYFARVFAARSSGGHKSRIVNQKETLSIIAKHRAAWNQTLLTNSVHREDDVSEDLVVARAIYSMYNSVPRDTDNATGKHKLKWHKYYDNSNEVMLWAVSHSFSKFLNRLTTKHGALDNTTVGAQRAANKSKQFVDSLSKTLLDICATDSATGSEVNAMQLKRYRGEDTELGDMNDGIGENLKSRDDDDEEAENGHPSAANAYHQVIQLLLHSPVIAAEEDLDYSSGRPNTPSKSSARNRTCIANPIQSTSVIKTFNYDDTDNADADNDDADNDATDNDDDGVADSEAVKLVGAVDRSTRSLFYRPLASAKGNQHCSPVYPNTSLLSLARTHTRITIPVPSKRKDERYLQELGAINETVGSQMVDRAQPPAPDTDRVEKDGNFPRPNTSEDDDPQEPVASHEGSTIKRRASIGPTSQDSPVANAAPYHGFVHHWIKAEHPKRKWFALQDASADQHRESPQPSKRTPVP